MSNVAIIRNQANIGAPFSPPEMERMAKRRFQDPKPRRRGAWWTMRVWRDEFVDGKHIRKQQRVRLAAATVPEREVRKMATEYLRPLNQGKKRNKPYLTPQQFDTLVELIPEPYASMVYVAIYTGLRVSELAGLRWNDVGDNSITIDERFCRGDWGAPKSEASNATIGVNSCVIERIHRLKRLTVEVKAGNAIRKYKVVKSAEPDDLVFQGVRSGGPLRDNNILVRFIKPAARASGVPWVNWRSLRTSHATWLKMAGADVKDAQAQMRHSRSSTTLDIYQQFVPESQQRAVERLSRLVN